MVLSRKINEEGTVVNLEQFAEDYLTNTDDEMCIKEILLRSSFAFSVVNPTKKCNVQLTNVTWCFVSCVKYFKLYIILNLHKRFIIIA